MWEQIQSNKRKTVVLVFGMALLLLALGGVIGEAFAPGGGGLFGIGIAAIIWVVMAAAAWFQGDNILLMMSGAKPIQHEDHPVLMNVVEEMKIASGLDHMPAVYLVNDMSPNAFAVGRKPEKAAVAVTTGLLGKLNRDELQGVIAHEIGHIVNRDVLLMSMLATMLGTITFISETFLRSLFYAGASRRYSSSSRKSGGGSGQAQMIMMVLALVFAILAPIAARLIYFAVSRKREYLADAQASVYTRYPEGLASALEKISGAGIPVEKASKATAAMYIINPFAKVKLSGLTATHPPAQQRIAILRAIGNVTSYGAYQKAWQSVGGKKVVGMPLSSLRSESAQDVRKAHPDKKTPRQQMREAGDLMRQMNQFIFLTCACGMKFKIPPEYAHNTIPCPKCSTSNPLPAAQMIAAAKIMDQMAGDTPSDKKTAVATAAAAEPIVLKRTKGEWQSIKCSCGATKSISSSFIATKTKCNECGRKIIFK
jgi:heat shock protein HtpX